ncbi:hypothetical protein [Microvirga massiliensis]|uniref:hypothetical protein n=1 Tax=Microvirga massiliensis TaxID=1033741 RepID=UPI00062B6B6B|nr:hypothetical protein [Microvirga massiliensis]
MKAGLENALYSNAKVLLKRGDVNAIALGYRRRGGRQTSEPSIKVFVPVKLPPELLSPAQLIPRQLNGGIETDVEEMDVPASPPLLVDPPSVPRATAFALAGPIRSLRMGESGGYYLSFAGSLGIWAKTSSAERSFGLFVSCNHVLADFNRAIPGAPVIQPALAQGGAYPRDYKGNVRNFVPLWFGPTLHNFVDAAAAVALTPQRWNEVHGIGLVRGIGNSHSPLVGRSVRKHGAGSGLTTGRIVAQQALVKVDYWAIGPTGRNTLFVNQIIADCPCQFGDSGSILFDEDNIAIGLLFAGSATHSFFAPLDIVSLFLGISLL